jgi:hypothetical protein
MPKRWYFIILCVIGFTWAADAQVKTNMQLFEALIDSSIINMENDLSYSKSDSVICILPSEAQTLSAYTLASVKKHTILHSAANAAPRSIVYTIEDMQIQYPEIGKYSFFGDNFLVRKATLKGSVYTSTFSDSLRHISYAVTDTIPLSERGNVELQNNKLTTAPLPAEPIFSSLLEPVIGVAAIAVTTYLLFTVRKTN